jgi:hypothetical protein
MHCGKRRGLHAGCRHPKTKGLNAFCKPMQWMLKKLNQRRRSPRAISMRSSAGSNIRKDSRQNKVSNHCQICY